MRDVTMVADGAEETHFDLRRVERLAWVLLGVAVLLDLALTRSMTSGLSLTAAGVVAIVNFRWLERVLHRVLQPGRPRFDRFSMLRASGRMVLLAGLLAAVALVPRVDPVAVAAGISLPVLALVIEGLRRAGHGGG